MRFRKGLEMKYHALWNEKHHLGFWLCCLQIESLGSSFSFQDFSSLICRVEKVRFLLQTAVKVSDICHSSTWKRRWDSKGFKVYSWPHKLVWGQLGSKDPISKTKIKQNKTIMHKAATAIRQYEKTVTLLFINTLFAECPLRRKWDHRGVHS